MIDASMIIKMDRGAIEALIEAQVIALEQTAEYLHTEVVQAQVMPFDTGHLQNESTYVDYSESKGGKVILISYAQYSQRLYYHPEYNFKKHENPNAGGEWYKDWLPGGNKEGDCLREYKQLFKRITGV